MGQEKEALITRIEGSRQSSTGRRQFDQKLRLKILEYVEREVHRGGHFGRLCSELGVPQAQVRRWRSKHRPGGFGAVKIVKPALTQGKKQIHMVQSQDTGEKATQNEEVSLTLRSPSGWTITGLDVAGLMALLPRLS